MTCAARSRCCRCDRGTTLCQRWRTMGVLAAGRSRWAVPAVARSSAATSHVPDLRPRLSHRLRRHGSLTRQPLQSVWLPRRHRTVSAANAPYVKRGIVTTPDDRWKPTQARWYAVVNDLVGGWAVSTIDKPLSQLDPTASEGELADFCSEEIARHIAELHNAWVEGRAPITPTSSTGE